MLRWSKGAGGGTVSAMLNRNRTPCTDRDLREKLRPLASGVLCPFMHGAPTPPLSQCVWPTRVSTNSLADVHSPPAQSRSGDPALSGLPSSPTLYAAELSSRA
ncbi:hypothetical protein SKAU_G00084870 [Synaphobranchus kaupii]|uniref:Uncharacterized protein n=1 Tax=Synaphobranchus kaupii TaxID=118154 RepID=A0A9Q1FW18_SYNKA|nr:hypothetical protein SKAU_G00084870 [Synaphobranchus kaupii]